MHLNRSLAILFSAATLLAVLWPVRENWRAQPKDNFPLSYFPMFSLKRDQVQVLNYFVGYDSLGRRCQVPYRFAGSGGFNQVRRQINKKVREEKGEKFTQKVAKRLSNCKEAPFCHLVRVELVRGEYDLDTYFQKGEKAALNEKIISSQSIERP